MEPEPGDTIILEDGTEVPLKKKRGRPKKVKLENGEVAPAAPRQPRAPRPPPSLEPHDQPPKKKRGRPKKIRPDDQQFLLQHPAPPLQALHSHDAPYMAAGDFPAQLPSPGLLYPHQHHQHHQQLAPDSNNYFQQQPPNSEGGLGGMESSGLDVSGGGGGMLGGMARGYGSPGGYAASPRGVYASPRSQGYSPSPARPAGTPQPQESGVMHGFPASPAFSAVSPPRAGSGGGYSSPAARAAPFSARSPLYAHSPAPYAHQQAQSPAPQARFSQSPHPHHPHPYSHSPAPQSQGRPFSRSPAPVGGVGGVGGVGTTPFPQASPAGALHSYTPSPAHTPYSQHSSPAPSRTPTYTESHHYPAGGAGGAGGAGPAGFGGELSHEIGAAISSPAPVSPGMAALDFEPPRDEPERDHSPMGSTDMHPGSNSNSSLSDYNKVSGAVGGGSPAPPRYSAVCPQASAGSDMSPAGAGFAGLYDDSRLQYAHLQHTHSPAPDKQDHYYRQDQGGGVGDSPRLDQLHQHPSSMYPSNYNRSSPPGGEGAFSPLGAAFRPPSHPHPAHTPHDAPGSPGEYAGAVKPKAQDVASKSLSGLESLVDQIPSIAEGPGGAGAGGAGPAAPAPPDQAPAAVAALPDYAPALYPPYGAYGGAAYGNNGYGGPFVGYGGGWGTAVMRPTPGYLSEWQYGYPAGVAGVAAGYAPYNAPYYNGYAGPPPAHHQQAHYLSAPPLIDLHKNGEHSGGVPAVPSVPSVPSVGFGGFC